MPATDNILGQSVSLTLTTDFDSFAPMIFAGGSCSQRQDIHTVPRNRDVKT